jgi:glycine cleavage system aminomethyltransferase T
VLELSLLEATIVACYAAAVVLDEWSPPTDAFVARVAQDELWVVGLRVERASLLRLVDQSLRPMAPDALVIDQTDGWTVWSIEGTNASHALARLTVMPLDHGSTAFQQGAVAGVPAKVVATVGGYQVFVPAPVGHHLRDRVLEACGDLAPAMGPTRPFDGPVR